MIDIKQFGWNSFFEEAFRPYRLQSFLPARVLSEQKHRYQLVSEQGEACAEVRGKLVYESTGRQDFPAVGDWVVAAVRPEEKSATIHSILPRQTKVSRKVAGNLTEEQILIANVDFLFLVNALDQKVNLRRIERYLSLAWGSGANPAIILTKADKEAEETISDILEEMEQIAFGVPVYVISSLTGYGIDVVQSSLQPGKTVALLGSSGAGKSTLINYLLGEPLQEIQEVREGDNKGKHTTTARELFLLPSGAILVDTPGMRELQLWDAQDGVGETFEDIELFTHQCRFTDCQHQKEPNCAVKRAIESGELAEERFNNYQKIQRELAYLERKQDVQARLTEKKKWKKVAQHLKNHKKK
ncbi:MAG: ribosome small subunit-dependent GTPase A [Planctomycetota bacterium]